MFKRRPNIDAGGGDPLMSALFACSVSVFALGKLINLGFRCFRLAEACIAIGNRVAGFSMSVGLQDVTSLLCTSLILFVFLCWLASVNQQCRAARVYFSEMCGAPAVTWMRWFVWTAAAHIKRKSSSVHFLSGSRAPYSNWIWASAFFFFFFKLFFCVCVCLWHVVSLEIHSTLPLFLQQLLDVPQCELCHE